jgi:hypothetical protein
MYTITFHDFQVQCSSADEVRALCGGSTNGIGHPETQTTNNLISAARNSVRKYRRKATDTRGKTMSERWEKARRYAKRHDVTPSEAFKILSK